MRYRILRYPTDIEVRVERGDELCRARLVNISSTGAKLTQLPLLPAGARVSLCYLHLRFPTEVVWSKERLTGLRFLTPLAEGDLNLLRGAGGHRPGAWGVSHGSFRELT